MNEQPEPKEEKSIHSLKLHETMTINNGMIEIVAVPGGWLYVPYKRTVTEFDFDYEPVAAVFVPEISL